MILKMQRRKIKSAGLLITFASLFVGCSSNPLIVDPCVYSMGIRGAHCSAYETGVEYTLKDKDLDRFVCFSPDDMDAIFKRIK